MMAEQASKINMTKASSSVDVVESSYVINMMRASTNVDTVPEEMPHEEVRVSENPPVYSSTPIHMDEPDEIDEQELVDLEPEVIAVTSEEASVLKLVAILFLLIGIVGTYITIGATVVTYLQSTGDVVVVGPSQERERIVEKIVNLVKDDIRLQTNVFNFTNNSMPFMVSDKSKLRHDMANLLKEYDTFLGRIRKKGWQPGHEVTIVNDKWLYSKSVLYCASLITTVGYGDIYPRNTQGRLFTIVYSFIGVPIYLISLAAIGTLLAKFIRLFVYIFLKGELNPVTGQVRIPVKVSLLIVFFYLLLGAIFFRILTEGRWGVIESFYFCFITLSTIGLGDYVYGTATHYEKASLDSKDMTTIIPSREQASFDSKYSKFANSSTNAIVSVMYLLVGLALVSMCITLMQEQMTVIFKKLFKWFKAKCFKILARLSCSKKKDIKS